MFLIIQLHVGDKLKYNTPLVFFTVFLESHLKTCQHKVVTQKEINNHIIFAIKSYAKAQFCDENDSTKDVGYL